MSTTSSRDPRQYLNDSEEGTRLALDGRQATVWTAMPAIVQSVDFSKMTCVCQITIQGRFEDQNGVVTFVNLPVIQDVPIVFPSAGGFSITFPMVAGDEVLVVFASRCIDSWWQNGGFVNKPMEFRMHDLSDGFAIPGPKSVPNALPGISTTACQIRNNTGTAYVEITADGTISLVSPQSINVTANKDVNVVATTGKVNVTATADKITLTSPVEVDVISPNLNVSGNVTCANLIFSGVIETPSGPTGTVNITGNLVATGTIVSGGISLTTHLHTGVTTGAGNTGGPI